MAFRSRPVVRMTFALAMLFVLAQVAAADQPLEFHLRFDPAVSKEPFTGRVYVVLSKFQPSQLPSAPDWFHPQPFFAADVKDWKPGDLQKITAQSQGFPCSLDQLPKGKYWAFAVMDYNKGDRSFITGEGNAYSKPAQVQLDPKESGPVQFTLNKVHHRSAFQETDRVKFVKLKSKYLSDFHKRAVYFQAGVVLPQSYAKNPNKRYPVIYEIPGFGGDHHHAHWAVQRQATDVAGVEMIHVTLDPDCTWGHHVFADSETNGPCGKALCQEFIPHIEKTFRGLGVPGARFVTGHSSGGWSSLWLQVTYPDFFGGTWSTAPDPVDFRDFQRVNIYAANANLFFDAQNQLRPLAHNGDVILQHFKPFSDMEEVMGHGGQLRSFEAVFSPKGADGQPLKLWDRKTGKIDSTVAKAWERYDIRLTLDQNWAKLGPKLAGKIHVYTGGQDTFYLEGATLLLKQALAQRGSDAVVEIFPGKDHNTLLTKGTLRERIAEEMARQFQRHQ